MIQPDFIDHYDSEPDAKGKYEASVSSEDEEEDDAEEAEKKRRKKVFRHLLEEEYGGRAPSFSLFTAWRIVIAGMGNKSHSVSRWHRDYISGYISSLSGFGDIPECTSS